MKTIHKKIIDYAKTRDNRFTKTALCKRKIAYFFCVDSIVDYMVKINLIEIEKWVSVKQYDHFKTVAIYKLK